MSALYSTSFVVNGRKIWLQAPWKPGVVAWLDECAAVLKEEMEREQSENAESDEAVGGEGSDTPAPRLSSRRLDS